MLRDVLYYLLRGLYLSASATVLALIYALFTHTPISIELISTANFYAFFIVVLIVGIIGFTGSRGRAARANDHVILMSGSYDSKREHQDMQNDLARSARWFVMSLTPLLIGFLLYYFFVR